MVVANRNEFQKDIVTDISHNNSDAGNIRNTIAKLHKKSITNPEDWTICPILDTTSVHLNIG